MDYKKFCLFLIFFTMVFDYLLLTEENIVTNEWTGDISLGFSLNKGNSKTINISFTFGIRKRVSDKLEWMNSGFFLFSEEDKKQSVESLGITSRLNWKHTVKLYTFYEIQGFRDVFKDYQYRLIPGIGLGFEIFKEKNFSLKGI